MKLETECISWAGRINEQGYGTVGVQLAHRKLWADAYGAIPPGMTLDHRCHDPKVCTLGRQCPHRRCVNLEHLELCTPEENKARGGIGWYQKVKSTCPEGHPYEGDNLLVSGGKRYCRTCRRRQFQDRREQAKRRRCESAGHEYAPQSDSEGKTYCAVCRAATAQEVGRENKRTHCPKGHPYSPENSYRHGAYVSCKQCNRDAMAVRSARKRERHAEEKGHAYELAEDVNGKPYCKVCRLSNSEPRKYRKNQTPSDS